jgi:UDP-N-acetylglucosamine 2-epimerase (non-hydrolysing)
VCYVEAGLRTNGKCTPFPEEINRQVTSRIAHLHFAPTETSRYNLGKENIANPAILITGNTLIDALLYSVAKVANKPSPFVTSMAAQLGDAPMILVTGHRRENHGQGFENICQALKEIAIAKPTMTIAYPVQLNPKAQEAVNRILAGTQNIILIDPLEYLDFIWIVNRATLLITDSGGVQEEAPSLGKPVLVMRGTTERPEAVAAGTVILVGTDTHKIVAETLDLSTNKERFDRMSALHNPYGDGKACQRIVQEILQSATATAQHAHPITV